jgi:hypothetical protein
VRGVDGSKVVVKVREASRFFVPVKERT